MQADNRRGGRGAGRRAFFRKIALFGGAAAVGTICGKYGGGASRENRGTVDGSAKGEESRYRETEHIRRYYERAST